MEPTSRRVSGSTGFDLPLLEWSTDGVPLLLLHGFGNEAHIWDEFAPAVAPYYRTLALDQRGHGDSGWDPEGRYAIDFYVDDVEAVTAELGIERLVLVGHSLGGRVSTVFAGRHPERVAGLVLVDIGPELDARGILRISQETESSVSPIFDTAEEYARLLSLHYPAATAQAIQRMARHGLRQRDDSRYELKQDPALRGAMSSATSETALREERLVEEQWEALRKIQAPPLVVRGAESAVLDPDAARRFSEAMPGGELVTVARCGHNVASQNTTGFLAVVAPFLARHR